MLEVSDLVLVKKFGLIGKNKLADKNFYTSYRVISKSNPDVPVYKVK